MSERTSPPVSEAEKRSPTPDEIKKIAEEEKERQAIRAEKIRKIFISSLIIAILLLIYVRVKDVDRIYNLPYKKYKASISTAYQSAAIEVFQTNAPKAIKDYASRVSHERLAVLAASRGNRSARPDELNVEDTKTNIGSKHGATVRVSAPVIVDVMPLKDDPVTAKSVYADLDRRGIMKAPGARNKNCFKINFKPHITKGLPGSGNNETIWMPHFSCVVCFDDNKRYVFRTWTVTDEQKNYIGRCELVEEDKPAVPAKKSANRPKTGPALKESTPI